MSSKPMRLFGKLVCTLSTQQHTKARTQNYYKLLLLRQSGCRVIVGFANSQRWVLDMGIINKLKGCAACQQRREKLKRIKDLANERIRTVIRSIKNPNFSD